MKIRIPLSDKNEALVTIAEPGLRNSYTKRITPEEFDALISALSAQREAVTGQSWAEVSADLDDGPDYAALVETVKKDHASIEIDGVRISPMSGRSLDIGPNMVVSGVQLSGEDGDGLAGARI